MFWGLRKEESIYWMASGLRELLCFSYLVLMKIRSLLFWFLKYYVYATCLFFRNVESEACERHDFVSGSDLFLHSSAYTLLRTSET